LAVYAFIRFLFGFFYFIFLDLSFLVILIAFVSFLFSSLMAITQIDVKKIIAYSSIAHMNFLLLGFFSQNILGVIGSFFMLFGHAITSSALFFGIGILYDRYKTRLLFYYGSLFTFMPIFSFFYFIFILSNFAFPFTINFVGEFLIGIGGFFLSSTLYVLNCFPLIVCLFYSLNLYVRIFFGNSGVFLRYYSDLTRLEFFVLFFFCFFVIFFGFFPNLLFSYSLFFFSKFSFCIIFS
jgi:NADH:ubiquinone oxidoreductase subunit 4 (subunit M)